MNNTRSFINSPLSYRLFTFILLPIIAVISLKKAIAGGGVNYLKQRLAFALPKVLNAVHFHGASVGEIMALLPLINAFKQQHPSQAIIITCNTPTAYQILQKQTWSHYRYCYLPLDFNFSVKRFIHHIQPIACVIIETELWPNLYAQCKNNAIKIVIINGRLSNKTLKNNRIVLHAYRFCMQQLHYVFARTQQDQQGFLQLGISKNKIKTLGNIKYQTPRLKKQPNLIARPYVFLASSHDDEEKQIATLWQRHPIASDYLLVIAPRHPERSKSIRKQLDTLGLTVAVRSKNQTITSSTQVYLADTIGEMAIWYQHASLVIMAGSFIAHGGQNFIEPASYGKAIITGPYTDNFKQDVALFLQQNAILQVHNIEQLSEQLSLFLSTPYLFNSMAKQAKKMLNAHIVDDYLQQLMAIFELKTRNRKI